MSAPTLHTPTKRPGLWPVLVGGLLVFAACMNVATSTPMGAEGVLGAGLLSWGVWRRWIGPRRAAERDAAARSAFLSDPARQARLAAWRDGTAFVTASADDVLYRAPCTWYSPTPSGAVKERDTGEVLLTRDAVRLSGDARSQELRLRLIRGLTAKRDGAVIERSNGPHLIVAVDDPEELVVAIDAVRSLA